MMWRMPNSLSSTRWAITLLLLGLFVLALSGAVDQRGFDYTERSFKRALITFGVARGLNAVISVAQGTEVAIEPAGVGVNFAPGEVLDPVNDLVERFSLVMLASTTALGLQRLLLEIFTAPAFTWLLGALLPLSLWLLWRRAPGDPWRAHLLRLLLVLLLLRFAVPLVALAGEGLYGAFLAERYSESSTRMNEATEAIRGLNRRDESEVGDVSLLDRLGLAELDVGGRIERYENAAADISEQVINLIVVFLMQTVLLPLLLLWAAYRLIRRLWNSPLPGI